MLTVFCLCLLTAYPRHALAQGDLVSREMRALCERQTGPTSEWFGRAELDRLERELASGDSESASFGSVVSRAQIAWHLIRLGEHERAIEQLRLGLEAFADLPSASKKPDLEENLLALQSAAYFLEAERQNCLALHNAASCIVPVDAAAVHREKRWAVEASRVSVRRYQASASSSAKWLANLGLLLAGEDLAQLPDPVRLPDDLERRLVDRGRTSAIGSWVEVSAQLGVEGMDLSGGAVVDDFDGDGQLDLMSSSWHPCSPVRAYRNTGDAFEEVGDLWGLSSQLGGLNLVHADYDGDGRRDLLVLRGAWRGVEGRVRNSLLRNTDRGDGRPLFVDVTARVGLAQPAYPTQTAAFADYDNDGDLDLFVGNEGAQSNTDPLLLATGEQGAYPSQLFRNDGGRFSDVTRQAGVANLRFAKGVAWGDVDDDGDPDLFVSNLGANRLFMNQGNGQFRDEALERGVAGAERSFATWFFDYDNDLDLDLFVASYGATIDQVFAGLLGATEAGDNAPHLYRNEGGRFVDVSSEVGFDEPLLVMGSNFGDLDGDGFLDLYLGTGVPNFDALMPNVAYHNERGVSFTDVTFESGLGHLQKGHGVAFGDLDGDGDEDLYQQLGGAYPYDAYRNALYLNPARGKRFVVLRLSGEGKNRDAIGARVTLWLEGQGGDRRAIHRQVDSGGSFGGSSLQLELGFDESETPIGLDVVWPGGRRTSHNGVEAGGLYEVRPTEVAVRPL